jgi:hypothetical protein
MVALALAVLFQVPPRQEEAAARIDAVERALAECERLAAAQRWGDLRALCAELETVDRYVKRGDRWIGLRTELRQLVEALPAEGRLALRGAAEDRATALWRAWSAEGDEARLREIERTCGDSSVAPAAIELLGNLAMDRGDLDEAIGCWSRLRTSGPVTAKLAQAWALAGRVDEVARLAKSAAESREEIVVAGRSVSLAAYVASLVRPEPKAEPAAAEAAAERGGAHFDVLQIAPLRGGLGVLALPDRVVAVRADGSTAWTVIDGTAGEARLGPLGAHWDGERVYATRFGAGRRASVLKSIADGRELWSIDEPAWRKALGVKGEPVISTPVRCRDVVCVAVNVRDAGETDAAFVAGVDPVGGTVRWARRLGSAWSAGAAPSLAAHGGQLVVSTNLGMLASVDPLRGDVAWIAEYPRLEVNKAWRFVPPGVRRANSPPVVWQGAAWAVPNDARGLVGVDLATGAARPVHEEATGLSTLARTGRHLVLVKPDHVAFTADPSTAPEWREAPLRGMIRVVADDEGIVFAREWDRPRLARYDGAWREPALAVGEGGLIAAGGGVVVAGRKVESEPLWTLRVAGTLREGGLPDDLLAYGDRLWSSRRWLDAADIFIAMSEAGLGDTARDRLRMVVKRSAREMKSAESAEDRAAFARIAAQLAPGAWERTEALEVMAAALLELKGREEEAIDAAVAVLSETALTVDPAALRVRESARTTVTRLLERRAARASYGERAARARRGVKEEDASALTRFAATYPHDPLAVGALVALSETASGASIERVVDLVLEVEARLTEEERSRLIGALRKRTNPERGVVQAVGWMTR